MITTVIESQKPKSFGRVEKRDVRLINRPFTVRHGVVRKIRRDDEELPK